MTEISKKTIEPQGEQTLIASVSSLPQEITFTATATPQATLEVGR